MSSQNLLESPTTPPYRSSGRHQIKRSLTEFSSPSPVRLHLARQQYDDRASSPNPSLMQKRHSVDMPRSEAATPIMSPNQSRRTSLLIQKDGDERVDVRVGKQEDELPAEQQPAFFGANGLRASLMTLNATAVETTRRLDETYYAVLEKMSALQTTVAALKDLAESSRDIQVGFERTAQELESDITKQLRSMGQFQTQQRTIERLQSRIHQGREKMTVLAARVDTVRDRVEAWERADKAWQERTRKRLRITWSALSIFILLLIILLSTVDLNTQGGAEPGRETGRAEKNMSAKAVVNAKVNLAQHPVPDENESATKLLWKPPVEDREQLHVFDEL